MTKEEFLIKAQSYYYMNGDDSEQIFNLMDDNVKYQVITDKIDDMSGAYGKRFFLEKIEDYEFNFMIKNHKLLFYYFDALIEEGEELHEGYFDALPDNYKIEWHNRLKKDYEEQDEEDWAYNPICKWFIQYKAEWREKQIDDILND